ncbi:MAG: NAD(P)/FAD-dependent oxidoreductase [Halobacteria archaeon]
MTVAVIGAGVTGLTFTHYYDDAEVFETRQRPGGVIRSERMDGRVLEYGPQRTRLTPAVEEVVDQLGVRDEIVWGADLPIQVYSEGELSVAPRSARELIGTDLLTPVGKARMLLEPVVSLYDRLTDSKSSDEKPSPSGYDRSASGPLTSVDGCSESDGSTGLESGSSGGGSGFDSSGGGSESISSDSGGPIFGPSVYGFFAKRFGEEASRKLFSPLYAGIYASDPKQMPAEHSLFQLMSSKGISRKDSLLKKLVEKRLADRETPPAVSFDGGMETITDSLYTSNQGSVHLGTPVSSIAETTDGVIVKTERGKEEFEAAVLTVPAYAAAELLEDDGRYSNTARILRNLRYNSLAYVHLHSDVDLGSMGFQIAYPENHRYLTMGVTANHSFLGRENLYTSFLGGMNHPGLLERDDEEIGKAAAEEFREFTGEEPNVIDVTGLPDAIPAYDSSWTRISGIDLPDGVYIAANYVGRPGVPSRIREARRLSLELS